MPSFLRCFFAVGFLGASFSGAQNFSEVRALPFLEDHCLDCHDSATQKGELNLEELGSNLNDPDLMKTWIRVHDRIVAGEMPPKKKKAPPAGEKESFLEALSQSLIEAEQKRDRSNGRSTMRRLNRHEYENSLRDLLGAPWLDVKDILPEDGEAHRFNKAGEALDISHVQMARYMQAADKALRSAIPLGSKKPESTTRRYYAREQGGMMGKVFFNEFNRSTYRSMIPLLGSKAQPEVISKKLPATVGAKDPETRELEGLGVLASSYEPIQPRFNQFNAKYDGVYKLRLRAHSFTAGAIDKKRWIDASRENCFAGQRDEPVSIYAIGKRSQRKLASIDVQPEAKVHEVEVTLRRGESIGPDAARLFRSRPPGPFHNPLATKNGVPGVAYRWLEVEGPQIENWPPLGYELLFGDLPIDKRTPKNEPEKSRQLLSNFIAKVYRRPSTPADTEMFLPVIKAARATGSDFSDAMIAGYTAVLCSPGFLCLEEPLGALDGHSLASRLSYFLWNSTPDQKLRSAANEGKLISSGELRSQAGRMLADPKSEEFLHAFLDSWLDLKNINVTSPDSTLYPDYYLDDLLTESALDETRAFFAHLIQEDLPARNLIDSDFIFANERLADHYGVPGVRGVKIRRIDLPKDSPRGGLMTQASVLKVTANGTTTSPVLRGNWILERILGHIVPPPPPGVGAVEPDIRGAETIRQQLDKHRESRSCNSCHVKIDPPGFALESFDVLGAWRGQYRALGDPKKAVKGYGKNAQPFTFHLGLPVDSTGKLASGESFSEIRSFKKLLLHDERAIARNMANQLITYATGTPVRFSDRPVLEEILNKCEDSGYGLRTLIHEVIQSPLFRSK